MLPNSSQVDDLCTELKLIARIVPDTKLHVGYRMLQPAQSLMTVFWRTLCSEDHQKTLRHVKEKTGRAMDFCDALLSQLALPISRDHFRMIRADLSACVQQDAGLRALRKTYDDKDQPAAELDVHIRKVEMRLEFYQHVLPVEGTPLANPWQTMFAQSPALAGQVGTVPSPLSLAMDSTQAPQRDSS
jgi:hypothetical protein